MGCNAGLMPLKETKTGMHHDTVGYGKNNEYNIRQWFVQDDSLKQKLAWREFCHIVITGRWTCRTMFININNWCPCVSIIFFNYLLPLLTIVILGQVPDEMKSYGIKLYDHNGPCFNTDIDIHFKRLLGKKRRDDLADFPPGSVTRCGCSPGEEVSSCARLRHMLYWPPGKFPQ